MFLAIPTKPMTLSSGVFGQSVETKNGIEVFNQNAGQSKDLFNPYRPPNNDEIKHLQKIVDEVYEDFAKLLNWPKKKVKVAKVEEPKQEEFKPENKDIDNDAPVIEIAQNIIVDSQTYTLKGKVKDKSKLYLEANGRPLKISKKDAFKQYLAYHEGWGNYKYYKKNKKVIGLAKKVERQSDIYKKQLFKCKNSLNKNKYIIF